MVNAAKTCAWKNVPKIDNEGAHGTAAFDDVRGDVVREMIEDDLMGNEFSNKWWGHVVPWCSKSLLISYALAGWPCTSFDALALETIAGNNASVDVINGVHESAWASIRAQTAPSFVDDFFWK